jgi:hypothetical protein
VSTVLLTRRTVRPLDQHTITPDLWVMAGAGGRLAA